MGNIVALGDSTKTHSVVIPKIELNLVFLNLIEKFLSVTWKISRFSPLIYTFSIVFCKIFQLKHRYRYDMLELAKMRYYIISYILENSKILYHLIYPTSRYNIRYISPKIYIFANTDHHQPHQSCQPYFWAFVKFNALTSHTIFKSTLRHL